MNDTNQEHNESQDQRVQNEPIRRGRGRPRKITKTLNVDDQEPNTSKPKNSKQKKTAQKQQAKKPPKK